MILGKLDAAGVHILPVPGALVAALQLEVPVGHQVRLRRDERVIAIAGREPHVIEREPDNVAASLPMRLRADVLQIHSLVQPLPRHGQPVHVVDERFVRVFHRLRAGRPFNFLPST